MPELPEVETTARGIEPHLQGRRIEHLRVHEPRLRWRVAEELADWSRGQDVRGVRRRGKYIVIDLTRGWLLVHLGMSGSLRILPDSTVRETHDHFDVELDSRWTLRFNDPRRFGSLHHGEGDPCAASAAGEAGAGTARARLRCRTTCSAGRAADAWRSSC